MHLNFESKLRSLVSLAHVLHSPQPAEFAITELANKMTSAAEVCNN